MDFVLRILINALVSLISELLIISQEAEWQPVSKINLLYSSAFKVNKSLLSLLCCFPLNPSAGLFSCFYTSICIQTQLNWGYDVLRPGIKPALSHFIPDDVKWSKWVIFSYFALEWLEISTCFHQHSILYNLKRCSVKLSDVIGRVIRKAANESYEDKKRKKIDVIVEILSNASTAL